MTSSSNLTDVSNKSFPNNMPTVDNTSLYHMRSSFSQSGVVISFVSNV